MSRVTNREYSSTDISSVIGYKKTACTSQTSGVDQPLACYPRENRSKKCESLNDTISEVTINNSICSSKSTQKRRVVRCKDTNDEELITYHLKLKPESLRYTFSSTESKKTLSEKHSDYQGTSGLACHSRRKDRPGQESSFSQNHDYGNRREKINEEKTTNCRPVINFNSVEFVEKTIDKNNRLKRLVRDIVEARAKEKKLEAWNNYINELKNKHANDYYGPLHVPEKYQVECDNYFNDHNVPCRCTSIIPCSSVNDDNFEVSKQSDYTMNSFPNDISCYPISSAARRLKNKTNDPPRRQYTNAEYIINAEEENPQKRKRRQLSGSQVRNVSAQTSRGIGTSSNDTNNRNQTNNSTKDELEGYEPCVCAAGTVRDSGTNTDKVEQETVTDIQKHTISQACFCNKDKGVTVTNNEIPILNNDSLQRGQHESEKTATFETVTGKMTKLKEELEQSKTCDNSLGIIEEKLDNIISTMNDLLAEVKLRITDMSTEKFDTATSTMFPQINNEHDTCIAHKLLKEEINIPISDKVKQSERYNFELFRRDKEKIHTVLSSSIPISTRNMAQLNAVAAPNKITNKLNVITKSTENTAQLNAILVPMENKSHLNSIVTPSEHKKLDNTTIPKEDLDPLSALSISENNTDPTTTRVGDQTTLIHAGSNKKADIPEKLEKKSSKFVADSIMSLIQSPGKGYLLSNDSKSVGETQPLEDPQPTSSQPTEDILSNVERSVIHLKKASKQSKQTLTHAETNKKADIPEKLEKKSSELDADPKISLIQSPGKGHLLTNDSKSFGETQPLEDPQSTSSQSTDDIVSNLERSVIDLKKASKSFMATLHRSGPNLTEDEMNKKTESLGQRLKAKFSSKAHHAKHSKEEKQAVSSISEKNKSTEENSDPNHRGNKKNSKKKPKDNEFCCVYANLKSIPRPRYRHASVTASLHNEISNAAEIILDVYYSNSNENDQTLIKRQYALVDRAVSKIDENIIKTDDNSNNTKFCVVVDRAVSKIDENIFNENHQQNDIAVDRAVSKIDDIIIEEINKSNQAKKDINKILNREFTNNYGVQITFELPTKDRGTEVTDSLSKTRVSNKSSSQGKISYSRPSRRTPLTIAAVNTDPMSLLGLFRMSTNTMRQLLTFMNFDYSSFLPSVNRAMPTVTEAVQYICHICGAAFRRPSELSSHMKGHNNMDTAKDCCVCRHMLQLRQRSPGLFACRFCGQCFTRAYCCELHERTCGRRRGRRLDVSDSRAILT